MPAGSAWSGLIGPPDGCGVLPVADVKMAEVAWRFYKKRVNAGLPDASCPRVCSTQLAGQRLGLTQLQPHGLDGRQRFPQITLAGR